MIGVGGSKRRPKKRSSGFKRKSPAEIAAMLDECPECGGTVTEDVCEVCKAVFADD